VLASACPPQEKSSAAAIGGSGAAAPDYEKTNRQCATGNCNTKNFDTASHFLVLEGGALCPHRRSLARRARTNAENSALLCLYSWRALVCYAQLLCFVMNCALTVVPRCSGHQLPMLFLYMNHSRRRRTRIEEHQGSLLPGGHGAAALSPWKRRARALAYARTRSARHEPLQQNCYGARAMFFAWLTLVNLQVAFVVSCCLLALSCRGGFALPCWWPSRGPHNHRARNPPP